MPLQGDATSLLAKKFTQQTSRFKNVRNIVNTGIRNLHTRIFRVHLGMDFFGRERHIFRLTKDADEVVRDQLDWN